jgi:2-amino-4-hydroxy-6-hydroxymethyldihydropteridine diphosphokinase
MSEAHHVYLSIGSNMDPAANLPKALDLLRGSGPVEAVSTAWETKPVGTQGANYLNACVRIRTPLDPEELKRQVIRPIEAALGRVRSSDRFAPRPIDLDLVLFDDRPLNLELWQQPFVAVPLAELSPDTIYPPTNEKLSQLALRVRGQAWIMPRPEILSGSS